MFFALAINAAHKVENFFISSSIKFITNVSRLSLRRPQIIEKLKKSRLSMAAILKLNSVTQS